MMIVAVAPSIIWPTKPKPAVGGFGGQCCRSRLGVTAQHAPESTNRPTAEPPNRRHRPDRLGHVSALSVGVQYQGWPSRFRGTVAIPVICSRRFRETGAARPG